MNAINSDNFLRELENDFPFPPALLSTISQPLIDEDETNELQWQTIDDTLDVEDLFDLVSAVPPPVAVVLSPLEIDDTTSFDIVYPPATAVPPPDIEVIRSPTASASNVNFFPEKKARVAAAHNLSERKRRQTINEKIRVLHEMVPNSKKSDTASMLDDIVEYVKLLQLHIKMIEQYYQQAYQVPIMVQASNSMWNPQVAPCLYPYQQVQIPNPGQQFDSVLRE